MFTLKRIEINNFRSIGHTVFEPPTSGVTALTGSNGSGKTAFVEALSFAMVGVIRKGTTKDSLRRQGSEGLCQVQVTIEHAGQDIRIVRGIQGVKNDTVAAIYLGNDPDPVVRQADPCTDWIRERLGGIEKEGLLVATLIRQKELADIVSDTPSVRRQRIERLAGIERMAAAVKTARLDATTAAKALEFLPGSAELVSDAELALGAAQEHAIALWEKVEKTKADEQAARKSLDKAETDLEDLERRLTAHRLATQAASETITESRSARERADNLDEQAQARQQAAAGGDPDALEDARLALAAARTCADDLRDARTKADAELAGARAAVAHADRAVQTADERAGQAKGRAEQATQRAAASQQAQDAYAHVGPDAPQRLISLRTEAEDAAESSADLRAQYKALQDTAETFDGDGSATCPTCTQDVHDKAALRKKVAKLMESVKQVGAPLAERATALRAQAETLAGDITQARESRDKAQRAGEQAAELTAEVNLAEQDVTAARKDIADAGERLKHTQTASEQAADPAALIAAEQVCEQATETYSAAQGAARAAASLPALIEQAKQARAEHTRLKDIADVAVLARDAAQVDDAEGGQLRAAATDSRLAHTDASTAAARADGDFRVAEAEIAGAEKERDSQKDAVRKRAKQAVEAEQAATAAAVLDEFRRRRVAELAPELADIASLLFTTLTDGKFIAVELDDAFTPTVTTADGARRPASWLSGGETDALAFALRVAIGEVVAGGKTAGLLVLDEAVSAQDENRRQAMMHAIQSLTERQVISISHMQDVTGLADCVYTVVPDDEVGSRIVLGWDDSPTTVGGDVEGLLAAAGA